MPIQAFISYSWDSQAHKDWVRHLAERLRKDGIDVRLDQWDVKPGESFTAYMEDSVSSCDFVIVVCTPEYARKANLRSSGVGYEQQIVSGYLVNDAPRSKFIPILRSGTIPPGPECAIPRLFFGVYAIDFRDSAAKQESIADLVGALLSRPRYQKPPLGSPMFAGEPASRARFSKLGPDGSQNVAEAQFSSAETSGAERVLLLRQGRTSVGITSWLEQRISELTEILRQAEHKERIDDARKQLLHLKDSVFHGLREFDLNQEANSFSRITALPSISGKQPRVLNEAVRCRQYLYELREHLRI